LGLESVFWCPNHATLYNLSYYNFYLSGRIRALKREEFEELLLAEWLGKAEGSDCAEVWNFAAGLRQKVRSAPAWASSVEGPCPNPSWVYLWRTSRLSG